MPTMITISAIVSAVTTHHHHHHHHHSTPHDHLDEHITTARLMLLFLLHRTSTNKIPRIGQHHHYGTRPKRKLYR